MIACTITRSAPSAFARRIAARGRGAGRPEVRPEDDRAADTVERKAWHASVAPGMRQVSAVDPPSRAAVRIGPADAAAVAAGRSSAPAVGLSWTTSAVTIPNIPSWPSACGRMWQWKAQAPGSSHLTITSQRSPGLTPSVSQGKRLGQRIAVAGDDLHRHPVEVPRVGHDRPRS